jgi:hypothetical protein
MAVAFRVNSLERSRTDFPSKSRSPIPEKAFLSNSGERYLDNLPIDDVVDSLGRQYRSVVLQKTSTCDQPSELRRLAIESELFTSLARDHGLGLSRLRSAWSSALSNRNESSQFDESYAKLGRWRLKGTEELRNAERNLLTRKRYLHSLVNKALDEDDVEVFNHACWLLSQRPMSSARILTSKLVEKVSGLERMTVDQWINGLEALSSIPAHYLVLFAPSIRNILLAAAQEKDEDIISIAGKLDRKLHVNSRQSSSTQWNPPAREIGFSSVSCMEAHENQLLPDKK